MRRTGAIREIDAQGRVVLPVEVRARLGIVSGGTVRITLAGRRIVIEAERAGDSNS